MYKLFLLLIIVFLVNSNSSVAQAPPYPGCPPGSGNWAQENSVLTSSNYGFLGSAQYYERNTSGSLGKQLVVDWSSLNNN